MWIKKLSKINKSKQAMKIFPSLPQQEKEKIEVKNQNLQSQHFLKMPTA